MTPEKEKNCFIRSPIFALVTEMRDKRGVVGDADRAINRRISGCTSNRPRTHTTVLRRHEMVRGRGRASQDSHRRGTCTRRSDGRRSRMRNTVWKPPQSVSTSICRRSGKHRRRGKRRQMLSHTKISCALNPQSKNIAVGGRSHPQGQDHQ